MDTTTTRDMESIPMAGPLPRNFLRMRFLQGRVSEGLQLNVYSSTPICQLGCQEG